MAARRSLLPCAALIVLGCGSPDERACAGWLQWGQGPGHLGQVCVDGQLPQRVLAEATIDPFGRSEIADQQGDLLVHYQVPLVAGDEVYLLAKGGSYSPACAAPDGGEQACFAWDSQAWNEVRYEWSGDQLVASWSVPSDWKPVPSEVAGSEPTFQPILAGDSLYIPAAGGGLVQVDRHSGVTIARPSPFAGDPDTYVSGPLSADAAGNIYYNALKLDHDQPLARDAKGFLVRVAPGGAATARSYDDLVTGAPTGMTCHGTFALEDPQPDLPWPPPDANGQPVVPPPIECGSQRPGVNVAPAIGADGTIFTVSRAHFTSQDSFVVALAPDLSTRWVTSLRDYLDDACGVNVPEDGDPMNQPFHCRPGTAMGVDRNTNQKPAGRVVDASSSSPAALPDGGVLYGAFTSYNGDRGHLFKLDAGGRIAGTYDFGWDYTPAVWAHDGRYSIVVKDNHYNFDEKGNPLGPYYITQLDADLKMEWQFKNTNTMSCTRDAAGALACVPDHAYGFEFCINAPAIDQNGTVYAGGEDGVVYAIGQGGVDKGHLFLSMALGATYTPLAIDYAGRLYVQNDGRLQVLGSD